jgi:hypothetical protein
VRDRVLETWSPGGKPGPHLARNGITGGAVYDAVIACVAERTAVDHLVTLNVADFQRVWPGGAARIISPQTHSPP